MTGFIGRIRSGCGGVSTHLTAHPDALAERSKAAGVDLYPGTLNLRVDDVEAAVAALGEPGFLTDTDNTKLGPLRWWPVVLTRGLRREDAFVVRHEHTGTGYIEVMAERCFRDLGWLDGDRVGVTAR